MWDRRPDATRQAALLRIKFLKTKIYGLADRPPSPPPPLSPIKELCQTLNEKGKEGGGDRDGGVRRPLPSPEASSQQKVRGVSARPLLVPILFPSLC